MKPIDTIIRTGLRGADTQDLLKELSSRLEEVKISDIEYRMNRQVESESKDSSLCTDEIKLALAKDWLGGIKDE